MARGRSLAGNRLVKNTAFLFLFQISTYAAPFLVQPYLSHVLSKAHYGLIAAAVAFNWWFMTLVEYGFNLTATRKVAIHRDDPRRVSQIFSSVMLAKALLTLLGFLLMFGIVISTPKLKADLSLYCITYLMVIGDLLFPIWLFQGLEKMGNLVWRDLSAKLLSLCLIFAFVHRDSDYLLAAGFQALGPLIAGIIGLITVRVTTAVRWTAPSWTEAIEQLREGWSIFLSMAATSLSYSTNIFLMNLGSGPVDVAYFNVAYRLIVAVRTMVSPVVQAIYPHISHMAFNSRDNAVAFIRRYALVLAAPFFLVGVFILVTAHWLIQIFGKTYLPAAILLQIFAFTPFLLALQHSFSTFFMLGFGYQREYSRIVLCGTVVNFAIVLPLLHLIWPPEALAIAGVAVELFMTAATYLFYRTHAVPTKQPAVAA